jgi:excinuclease ABC subunit A
VGDALRRRREHIKKRMQESSSEVTRQWYGKYFREQLCRACNGARLRPESRAVLLADKTLVDVTSMTVAAASGTWHRWG